MQHIVKETKAFSRDLATAWTNDHVLSLSASLAFYTVLTIPPLLISLTSMTSAFLGEEQVRTSIINLSSDLLTPRSAEIVQELVIGIPPSSTHGIVAIFSTLTVLLIASGIFIHIKRALNAIWDIAPKQRSLLKGFFLNRLLGFFMLIFLGTLFIGAVLAATLISLSSALLAPIISPIVTQFISVSMLAIILLFFFTTIFKFLPDAKIGKKEAFVGALASTTLFVVGNIFLNMYLRNAGVVSVYGAAGSIIALLLWMYYSSATLFFGAEVAHVYATRYGKKIKPKKGAKQIHTIRV